MTVTMMRRRRNAWPKGTYMRIKRDVLREYVLNRADMDLINAGKEHKVNPRKISQRLLAEKAGVNPSFINHLTAGRRSSCNPEVAEKIAESLEVPLMVLFAAQKSNVGSTQGAAQYPSIGVAA
ncbi:helix-turn-helix domain-containing protein [Arthrobacter koreensis]|uniref:helix-turn-helix domain-containing protein n=1 Tax=Arthrobacter koreensis TaxID=199136 RepID=UPI0036307291